MTGSSIRGASEVSLCYNEIVTIKWADRSKFLIPLIIFILDKHVDKRFIRDPAGFVVGFKSKRR
jgi:hypothetical protein